MENQSALKIQRAWFAYISRKYNYSEEEQCRICKTDDAIFGLCIDCIKDKEWTDRRDGYY